MKRIKCAAAVSVDRSLDVLVLEVTVDRRRWMFDPGAAEIRRDDDRRDDRAAPGRRRLPQGAKMVVLFIVKHLYLLGRAADRTSLAGFCFSLLSKRARTISKWPEAKGTKVESKQGVRGDFYDRGQGLGWRVNFRSNHYWTYPGESLVYFFTSYRSGIWFFSSAVVGYHSDEIFQTSFTDF